MQRTTHVLLVVVSLALSGCGQGAAPAPASAGAAATVSSPSGGSDQAVASIGDVTVRASVVQTSRLPASIARQYGIGRDPGRILLLVTVRAGDAASASPVPVRVTAASTDLRGGRQQVPMREIRVDDPAAGPGQVLVDHIGTVETSLPETLRFEVAVTREGGGTATLRLTRDFHP
jgi:hypothetical protein